MVASRLTSCDNLMLRNQPHWDESMQREFEYRHIVGFEDTSVVGNVYYVNHLKWQGRCRELFLRQHAPEILDELAGGLSLATVRCSCEYLAELVPFDEIVVRMRLMDLTPTRMSLGFEYYRGTGSRAELVARGEQQIACLRKAGDRLVPTQVPASLASALRDYAHDAVT